MNIFLLSIFLVIILIFVYLTFIANKSIFNPQPPKSETTNITTDYFLFNQIWSSPTLVSLPNSITLFDGNIYSFFNKLNVNSVFDFSTNTVACSSSSDECYSTNVNNICYDDDQLSIVINQTTCEAEECINLRGQNFKMNDIYTFPAVCTTNCQGGCVGVVGYISFDFNPVDNDHNILGYDEVSKTFKIYKYSDTLAPSKDSTVSIKEKCIFRIVKYSWNTPPPSGTTDVNLPQEPEAPGVIFSNLKHDDSGVYAYVLHRSQNKILDVDGALNLILSPSNGDVTDCRWYLQKNEVFTTSPLSVSYQRCALTVPDVTQNEQMIILNSSTPAPTPCPTTATLEQLLTADAFSALNAGTIATLVPDFTKASLTAPVTATINPISSITTSTANGTVSAAPAPASSSSTTVNTANVVDGTVVWNIFDQFTKICLFENINYDNSNFYSVECFPQMIYVTPSDILNINSSSFKDYLKSLSVNNKIGTISFNSLQIANNVAGAVPSLAAFSPYSTNGKVLDGGGITNISYTQFIPFALANIFTFLNNQKVLPF
jgi:hypothetical protein